MLGYGEKKKGKKKPQVVGGGGENELNLSSAENKCREKRNKTLMWIQDFFSFQNDRTRDRSLVPPSHPPPPPPWVFPHFFFFLFSGAGGGGNENRPPSFILSSQVGKKINPSPPLPPKKDFLNI